MEHATLVSAPGKVLMCGGYLVLEKPNIGLVVSVSARFHAEVRTGAPTSEATEAAVPTSLCCDVSFVSPQFGTEMACQFSCSQHPLRCQLLKGASEPNPFVDTAIAASLAVVCGFHKEWDVVCKRLHTQHLRLKVYADNDFYSQTSYLNRKGLGITSDSIRSVPDFNDQIRDSEGGIGKTGLGSSAGLVTSIVGALLQHFGVVQLPLRNVGSDYVGAQVAESLTLIHTVAQFAHSLAQGKVGSGFDVCAATYGSGMYTRFNPNVIKDALATFAHADIDVHHFLKLLQIDIAEAPAQSLGDWSSCPYPLPSFWAQVLMPHPHFH